MKRIDNRRTLSALKNAIPIVQCLCLKKSHRGRNSCRLCDLLTNILSACYENITYMNDWHPQIVVIYLLETSRHMYLISNLLKRDL